MAINMKASDVVEKINEWTMEEEQVELDNKSLLHLLKRDSVGAAEPLIDSVELFLTKKKDGPVRIDADELDDLEENIKKYCGKYV